MISLLESIGVYTLNLKPLVSLVALLSACSAMADTDLGVIAGRHFFVTSTSGDVTTIRNTVSLAGGVLASVRSQAEQDGLATATSGFGTLYIGFSDEITEGTFLWDDGWSGNYTAWSGGEPNNVGGENYTLFNWGSNGTWNDITGGYQARAIYTQAVPEPCTMAAVGLCALTFATRRRKV